MSTQTSSRHVSTGNSFCVFTRLNLFLSFLIESSLCAALHNLHCRCGLWVTQTHTEHRHIHSFVHEEDKEKTKRRRSSEGHGDVQGLRGEVVVIGLTLSSEVRGDAGPRPPPVRPGALILPGRREERNRRESLRKHRVKETERERRWGTSGGQRGETGSRERRTERADFI